MPSLNQFAYVAGTDHYRFGHNSIPNIPITGAPADANLARWSMLHDDAAFRLYCFKGSSRDAIYQFSFNGASYAFGHNSIPELRLEGFPADVDASSFSMLFDGADYRLYMRRLGHSQTLYQGAWVRGTNVYRFGHNSTPQLPVIEFPGDTDWSRWSMLHDGVDYRFYAFKLGSNTQLYQGAFNRANNSYQFGFNSIRELTLVGTPSNSDTDSCAMLHDNTTYRFYFQTR